MKTKSKPIILSELSDDHLKIMYESVDHTINYKGCEDCTPPPEVFQLYQNIIKEMEARNLM